jgi:WD40 repeat protein
MYARALKHKFTAHSLACNDFAFSPHNQILMVSVGLDCRIHFYDIETNRVVKSMNAGEALSSIGFCSDGHTIAVGSETSGAVLIYDLKESAKNVKMKLQGHDGNQRICSVQFTRVNRSAQRKEPEKIKEPVTVPSATL